MGKVFASLPVPKVSGLINDHERQIAARVRHVRKSIRFSQSEFATVLGETVNRIASIEYARTPLTVAVADKISGQFNINLKWLKTGLGEMKPSIGYFSIFVPNTKASTLLSHADADELESRCGSYLRPNVPGECSAFYGPFKFQKGKTKEMLRIFHDYFDAEFNRLPHHGREKLISLAIRTVRRFSDDWMRGDEEAPGENIARALISLKRVMQQEQALLDTPDFLADAHGVPEIKSLQQLINELKRLSEARGLKADLARSCGVSRQAVDQWFSGRAKPSAAIIFDLFVWVRKQTEKTK